MPNTPKRELGLQRSFHEPNLGQPYAGQQARDFRLAAPAGDQALHDRNLYPRRALRTLERPRSGLDGKELPGMGGCDLPRARRTLENSGLTEWAVTFCYLRGGRKRVRDEPGGDEAAL